MTFWVEKSSWRRGRGVEGGITKLGLGLGFGSESRVSWRLGFVYWGWG